MKKSIMKIVPFMLAAVMGLSGCGSKKSDDAVSGQDSNVLKVVTNATFAPFEYIDEAGNIVGFDIELIGEVAKIMGKEIEISDIEFENIFISLDNGNADIGASGLTIKEERKDAVTFTDPYFSAKQVVIVKSDDTSITSQEDLVGKKIGAQQGTTGADIAEGIESAQVITYAAAYAAVMELDAGKLDAIILDNEPSKGFTKEVAGLKIVDVGFENEEYAIAVAKGNDELATQINEALATLKSNGKYDELIKKYFE